MERTTVKPAHSNSIFWGIVSRWLLCIIFLFSLCFSPIQPAKAKPVSQPLSVLDSTNKISLPVGVSDGALAWGDYNNDGQLDLLVTGTTSAGTGKTSIFTNNSGTFTESSAGLEQVQASSAAWGDYDNDGYLDVLLTGYVRIETGNNVIGFAGVYHNEASGSGRTFVLKQTLTRTYSGSGTWGDYNNDGKLDILLTGYTDGAVPFSKIYSNTGNFGSTTIFDVTGTPSVTALGYSAAAWADYDQDGYIDFAISGKASDNTPFTRVYHNNGNGTFSVIPLQNGLWDGTVTFLDYDIDGYIDLLVTGNAGTDVSPNIRPTTILYRYDNSNEVFTEVQNPGLPNIWNSSVSIGDYNNDGYPDIALAGKALADQPIPLPNQVFINNKNGTFSNANAGLPDGAGRALAWGDFNGDNTLDLAVTGIPVTDIYPNTPVPNGNTAPSVPVMQAACWDRDKTLTLNWSAASDSPAPVDTLTYNVRVGTTQNGQNVLSPASSLSTGYHRLPTMGNAATGTSAILQNLPFGTYYWSVQAIDAAFVGSPFDDASGRIINYGSEVAQDDNFSVQDNQVNTLNVLWNDKSDGGTISIYSFTQPAHGALTRNNNDLLYTPYSPYAGSDSFDYYAVRDNTLYCSKGTVKITVTQYNDPPTDILLSNNQVPDGSPSGTQVGRLSTIDPDANETFTYSLLQVNDWNSFSISENQLKTAITVHYNTKDTYNIRIQSTDHGGLSLTKDFTITVVLNRQPRDISLDYATVLEHQAVGTIVGSLSTDDPDSGDTIFNYSLETDPDNPSNNYDNDKFYIFQPGGTKLRTFTDFDANVQQTYHVRIRTTDPGGLFFEKVFTITILPTIPSLYWFDSLGNEHPSTTSPAISMSEDGVDNYGNLDPFHLTVMATDLGVGETLQWSISQQATHGTAVASGTTSSDIYPPQQFDIGYIPNANWNSDDKRGNDSFVVRITDSGGHYADLPVQVNIKAVNDPPNFDPINDQVTFQRPTLYSILITNILSGPPNESEQTVQMSAYCIYQCDSTQVTSLSITPVQANHTAILTYTLGPGAKTSNFAITVEAYDGESFKNNFSRIFWVSYMPGIEFFLPLVHK
jgi:hypothetical protein